MRIGIKVVILTIMIMIINTDRRATLRATTSRQPASTSASSCSPATPDNSTPCQAPCDHDGSNLVYGVMYGG